MSEKQQPKIPALSLIQPWASLVAIGAKTIETRSWAAPRWLIGKPVAIHASKGFPREVIELCHQEPFNQALYAGGYRCARDLPLGSVVAIARLRDCRRVEELKPALEYFDLTEQEEAFGDYSPGRFGWLLEVVTRLDEPIPARGSLGIWQWEPPVPLEELR